MMRSSFISLFFYLVISVAPVHALFKSLYSIGRSGSLTGFNQLTPSMPQMERSKQAALSGLIVHTHQNYHTDTKSSSVSASYKPPFAQARIKYYKDLEAQPWHEVAKKYQTTFQQEEQKIKQGLYNVMGITAEEWQEHENNSKADYITWEKRNIRKLKKRYGLYGLPHALVCLAIGQLEEFHIDPREVVLLEDHAITCMSATQKSLHVHPNFLDPYWWKPALAHEIQHILHDDSFQVFAMKSLLFAKIKPGQGAHGEREFFKFLNHIERRADIFAGLAGLYFSKTSADFFADLHKKKTINSSRVHDPHEVRAAYLEKLHTEMLASYKHE